MEQVNCVATSGQKNCEGLQEDKPQDNRVAKLCPLFCLSWVDPQRLWNELKAKEAKYQHSLAMFEHHPDLDPHKRAVLLSWLSEVCEGFKLHRETYYLSLDLVDRFLLQSANIHTCDLQLAGITALMLAAKMEEIDPPNGNDFVYVTDGACHWTDTCAFELFMAEKLSWTFASATPNMWLQLYLQMAAVQSNPDTQTARPCNPPSPSQGPTPSQGLTDTHSDRDMTALVERTNTIHLAKTDDTARGKNGGISCKKVASSTRGPVKGDEVCERFRDAENCGQNKGSDNKENVMIRDEHCDSNTQKETSDKVDRNICDKGKEKDLFCEEKPCLVKPHQEKGEDTVGKKTEVCNNRQEKDVHESASKINIYNYEKEITDKTYDTWTEHLYPIQEEASPNVEAETKDTDVEKEDDMEDFYFEEDTEEGNVVEPLYSAQQYVKASQLMDLVMLDSNSLRFQYSVLAAAVMFHSGCCEDVYQLTGLAPEELDPCIEWTRIHKMVVETSPKAESWGTLQCDCECEENCYGIQSHFASQSMGETAMKLSDLYFASGQDQDCLGSRIDGTHFG